MQALGAAVRSVTRLSVGRHIQSRSLALQGICGGDGHGSLRAR